MLLYLQHTVSLCFHHYEPQALLQNLKILAKIETAQFYVSFPHAAIRTSLFPETTLTNGLSLFHTLPAGWYVEMGEISVLRQSETFHLFTRKSINALAEMSF